MITAILNPTTRSIGALVASVAAVGCSESEMRTASAEEILDTVRLERRTPLRSDVGGPTGPAHTADAGATKAQEPEAERLLAAAAVGGEPGQRIGERMDALAQTLSDEMEGADVARHSEGIVVTIGLGILFEEGSHELAPAALDYLARLAEHMVSASRMDLTVIGHTDRLGSAAENLALSEERASAAADVLHAQGVDRSRISTVGMGESEPVALDDATSEEAARVNRRIEIAIYAGAEMQTEASAPLEDG